MIGSAETTLEFILELVQGPLVSDLGQNGGEDQMLLLYDFTQGQLGEVVQLNIGREPLASLFLTSVVNLFGSNQKQLSKITAREEILYVYLVGDNALDVRKGFPGGFQIVITYFSVVVASELKGSVNDTAFDRNRRFSNARTYHVCFVSTVR